MLALASLAVAAPSPAFEKPRLVLQITVDQFRGDLPAEAASYVNLVPEMNDGKTLYTLTVKEVPVDAFWSVTIYDDKGWMPVNKYNAYSFNNVTSKKNKDGSITIRFGGDPKQLNFLPIVPGWNYIVRLSAEEGDPGWDLEISETASR